MILINASGIQDSGGITVLKKLLNEIKNTDYKFYIVCNQNENIEKLLYEYESVKNFEFLLTASKGFLHRLYYENIVFRDIINEKNINLVYNFSGSTQFFFQVPQITKVQNLLFYSKKIDKVYFQKKQYLTWIEQIALKRLVFHGMINQTKYIEVQSNHVKECMGNFINISKKQFFIKSDIEVKEELFRQPKEYDFSKKLRFLYIVGPHFEYLHKNFEDFVEVMKKLKEDSFDFEIVVTLTKEQLQNSTLWDKELDEDTTFLGYVSKDELEKQFKDNTILISTSVIETLGLHVIEAIQNGLLSIVPDEVYSKSVYGNDILTYEIFNSNSLVDALKEVVLFDNNDIRDKISKNQHYLIENENTKYKNIVDIFGQIIKDKNVQR